MWDLDEDTPWDERAPDEFIPCSLDGCNADALDGDALQCHCGAGQTFCSEACFEAWHDTAPCIDTKD